MELSAKRLASSAHNSSLLLLDLLNLSFIMGFPSHRLLQILAISHCSCTLNRDSQGLCFIRLFKVARFLKVSFSQ